MRISNTNRNLISIIICACSIFFWVILLFNPFNIMPVKHCQITLCGGNESSFKKLLAVNSVSDIMIGWILMVFAMMLPKLIVPIQLINEHCFKHMRLLMVFHFILGYAGVWIFTGFLLNLFILYINSKMPGSFVPAVIIGVIALIWQFSPVKQKCLNKGHHHPVLAAWGIQAYKDAFVFGCTHGFWCVGAGWALMFFPMLLPQGHNFAMLVVTFIMLSEHMEHPQIPRWRIDFRLKLLKILMSQNLIKR